ncbi:hypothetical protein [Stenotrophomonas sp. SY1]|uniref:hypothetical protein n=1 Tax=Stenotrophomonas sp. SY1 TaxID=477235 RepID=UPI001E47F9FD|nr:hypothetical protein [Stenotrophomonas sp. SY1]MCD9085377.1 hypothetical protein [Stenotrophomonas sp. SY1]
MSPPELPSRASAFVDLTAKLSLLMGVLGVVWCLLQLLAVSAFGRMDLIAWLEHDGLLAPDQLRWFQAHATTLTLLMLISSVLFLAACWGFFKRREWGRRGLIIFLVLVALANVAALPLINIMFDTLQAMVPADLLASPGAHDLRVQLRAGRWFSLLSAGAAAIGLAALHAWLVVKLQRPQVRALFH